MNELDRRLGWRHHEGDDVIDLPSESTGFERFDVADQGPVDVVVHRLRADRWPERIRFEVGSYTNKVLIDHDGEAVFPEIALVRIARDQGWNAAWIDTYHRKRWADMPEQSEPVVLPEAQERLLASIEGRTGRPGGCWDVIAWRGADVAFIESKSTDRIRESQRAWLAAAITHGVSPSSFAIAEWSVSGSAGPRPAATVKPSKPAAGSRRHSREKELREALPARYEEKVKRLGLTLVSDNTLRRIRAGSSAYPSRVAPLVRRNLIATGGTSLTEQGARSIEMLEPLLPADGYPDELLR